MSKEQRVLVTGSEGQLGQSILSLSNEEAEFDFTFIDKKQLDLSDLNAMKNYFEHNNFDFIINCAAYTAVDKAEQDDVLADEVNHIAVKHLASIAKNANTKFIHISTDYVFDGEQFTPYTEDDTTNPKSVYGATKLQGEQAVLAINPNGAIIRTSWVYSEYGNNFVKTMLRLGRERDSLGVIFDQVGTPTYAHDLAYVIITMIKRGLNGMNLYHFSNEGVCSWYDFAKTIFDFAGIDCEVNPIETSEYPTPAKRPHYSILNKAKIKQEFTITIPYWKNSLKTCLDNLNQN